MWIYSSLLMRDLWKEGERGNEGTLKKIYRNIKKSLLLNSDFFIFFLFFGVLDGLTANEQARSLVTGLV